MGGLAPGDLVAFCALLAAAWAVPGPAMILATQTTLAQGRGAGLAAGIGLAVVAAGWTGAALAGLEVFFAAAPWAEGLLRLAGALYLAWLAWRIWRTADAPAAPSCPGPAPSRPDIRVALIRGVLVNLGNPKSVLFAASAIAVTTPAELTLMGKLTLVGAHLGFELVAYATLAAGLGSRAARRALAPLQGAIARICAGLMAALGLRLLLDRAA